MAQNQAARPGGQGQADAVSGAQLNQIVIEYLNKKGYNKTEAMLRIESAHVDAEGRPIVHRVEDDPETMYDKAYTLLKDWIDTSLGLYQPQLRKLLFPVFVHSFLDLITKGFVDGARRFFETHKSDHESTYGHDIRGLSAITAPLHAEANELAKLYKANKYRLILSKSTNALLTHWLNDNEAAGGSVILRILNNHMDIKETQEKPTLYSAQTEYEIGDNEGIVGHVIGRPDIPSSLERVKLGPLPMDKEFIGDVEEQLRDIDMANQTRNMDLGVSAGPSLMETFQRIKREESEDAPMREDIPLPPYKGTDIAREVQYVKDTRDRFKLEGTPTPPLPSICMYTFHHTNNGLNTVEFSRDGSLVAGGFSESYIKLWNLKGDPLTSAIPSENSPNPSSTRRLIGHAGPVYGVSFSPDSKYLLSCSEDKSARLWSLDTYTNLVVYKGHDKPIWDVAFGPFGHYFATASYDNTARLWSCDHIYPLRIFAGHTQDVDCVTFHPNSAYVFTGSSDKTARMWDINRGASVRLFSGHTAPITAIAASPNGQYLATAAEDYNILLWDLKAGKRMKVMKGHGKTSIYSLAFSAESTVLVSGGADQSVRVWNVGTGSGNPTVVENDGAGGAGTGDPTAAALGGAGAGAAGGKIEGTASVTVGKLKKGGKDVVATPDHLAVYYTKKSPVYKVHFTPRNLVLVGGAFLP